jgi:hypothetical protein
MTISCRYYIFEENGTIARVPQRIANAMTFGNDAIPEYAGSRQKVASIILENQDGKPIRILNAEGSYWEFDEEGKIDESLRKAVAQLMSFAFDFKDKNSKVVSLSPKLKKREFDSQHRWTLTKDDLDRVAADIWLNSNDVRANVKSVKGKALKKPPLTYEAKQALSEISSKAGIISWQIEMLSERALKGLAFEARERAKMYSDEPPFIWNGIADECDRRREIISRHRTGKGEWYAVLELFRKTDPHSSESFLVKFEKCEGKRAAEVAARKLLIENADKFNADISLDVKVYSDLEWDAPED